MKNKMYRVQEFDSKFTIEIGLKNFLNKIKWYPVNEKGEKATGGALSYDAIGSFESLKKAKKKIKIFKEGIKYHNI